MKDEARTQTKRLNILLFPGVEEQARFSVNCPEVKAEAEFRKLQKVIAKIYLGYLAHDLEFLKTLTEDASKLEFPNKKSTKQLYEIVKRNYGRAVRRQSILRMRRPLYVMLFERKAIPKGHKVMIDRGGEEAEEEPHHR